MKTLPTRGKAKVTSEIGPLATVKKLTNVDFYRVVIIEHVKCWKITLRYESRSLKGGKRPLENNKDPAGSVRNQPKKLDPLERTRMQMNGRKHVRKVGDKFP